MKRARLVSLAIAIAACGGPASPPEAPAVRPPPAPPPPAFADAAPCAYGLGGPPIPLFADERSLNSFGGAHLKGKLLVAAQVFHGDDIQVDARLLSAGAVTATIPISPRKGRFAQPRVVAAGDRFVVAFSGSDHGKDKWQASFVSLDGKVSPPTELPGEPPWGLVLAAEGNHFLAAWTQQHEGCRLLVQELDAGLVPVGEPAKIIDAESCYGEAAIDRVGDELWASLEINAKKSDYDPHAVAVRLDAHARPLAPPITFGERDVDTGRLSVMRSPRGALALWSHEPARKDGLKDGIYQLEVDAEGHPLRKEERFDAPKYVPRDARLRAARGRPVLVWDGTSIVSLDWAGRPNAEPTRLAAFSHDSEWVETDADPWLLWKDFGDTHEALLAAPVRCGGATSPPREPAPVIETKASLPPPKVVPHCRALKLSGDVAIAKKDGQPSVRGVTAVGGAIWATWEAFDAQSVREVRARRYRASDATPLGPEETLLAKVHEPSLVAVGNELAAVYERDQVVHLARLDAAGKVVGDPVALSHPLAPRGGGVSALALGDRAAAFWWAGPQPFLQAASFGPSFVKPRIDIGRPDRGVERYVVGPAPEGWVAAWVENDDHVRVARMRGDALAWSATASTHGNGAFVPLGAVGVLGDQVYVFLVDGSANRSRLVRFTLDGARLDEVAVPLQSFHTAAIGPRGIAIVTEGSTDKRLCLHLFGGDGALLVPAACDDVTSRIYGASSSGMMSGPPPPIVWSGDTLWYAYQGADSELRLRRWTCSR